MRNVEIPYGCGTQTLMVDDHRLLGVLTPSHWSASGGDQSAIVTRALEHPIGSPRLCELAKGKTRVLIITSDHTRPVPSNVTMPLLLEEIRKGNPEADIALLIATGMHRASTREELLAKLGEDIVRNERIEMHRADVDADMADFGTLPSGGALRLNKMLLWADLVVAEGFVEPHFFAGFSGGRKSVLPGVAAKETVLYNHNARFIADARARQGVLTGNPLHRDMLYAAKQARLAFILNVLIDADKRVTAAFAGDPEQAHLAGCALCEELTSVEPITADIVVTSNGGYPLDQNIYQSVKGMTAGEACVRWGGVIILCAALGDGHGGDAFYHWLADRESADSVTRDIERIPPESTRMDQWEAQILARVLRKATVFFVTGEENRALIENMHMRWSPNVNAALSSATKLLGVNSTVVAIPDGVGVIVQAKHSTD